MPYSKSHGIERLRRYSGEEFCMELIPWLNDPTLDRGKQRVREILELYRYVNTGWEPLSKGPRQKGQVYTFRIGEAANLQSTKANMLERMQRLTELCRKYTYYPNLATVPGAPNDIWMPGSKQRRYYYGWPAEYDEIKAVMELCQLAQVGLLSRLQKCACGRWIFARFSHQRFCSSKCREKAFKSDPAEKEKRRAWARKNYWVHKNKHIK